jgi:hypothetical protein
MHEAQVAGGSLPGDASCAVDMDFFEAIASGFDIKPDGIDRADGTLERTCNRIGIAYVATKPIDTVVAVPAPVRRRAAYRNPRPVSRTRQALCHPATEKPAATEYGDAFHVAILP